MATKKVTILIPNYKTPEITKICLRLLRKYTSPELAEIIVIDNHSQDASTQYLKSLKWIKLIERQCEPGESGVQAHSRALDLALEQVTTPFVLSIHTDTFVKRVDWLETLLAQFSSPKVAGVGSWKLESKNAIRRAGESYRVYRRLTFLRELADEQKTWIFTRSTGTRGSTGIDQRARPSITLGCDTVSCRKNRLYA